MLREKSAMTEKSAGQDKQFQTRVVNAPQDPKDPTHNNDAPDNNFHCKNHIHINCLEMNGVAVGQNGTKIINVINMSNRGHTKDTHTHLKPQLLCKITCFHTVLGVYRPPFI